MVDAVVIGGGIVGTSVGYHLARTGAKAIVVDRRDAGRATDAGAGIITPGGQAASPEPWSRLVGEAEAYYPALVDALREDGAADTGYSVCGSLLVAVDDCDRPAFKEISAGVPEGDGKDGPGSVVVTAERARELFPPLREVVGAVYEPTGARVDGRKLASALEEAGVSRGMIVRRASAERILVENGIARGIVSEAEEIAAGHVVIAGGAWSSSLGDQLETQLPIEPMRGQIAHLDVGDTDPAGWPIVSGFRGHYMVPWDDHRVVVGATREEGSGFGVQMTVEGVLEVLVEAIRVAPGLRGCGIREVRVGLRPASRDGYPVIGTVPRVPNVHIVTGHGSMGLHLGPYSGKRVADEIVGEGDYHSLRAFGAERFMRSKVRIRRAGRKER